MNHANPLLLTDFYKVGHVFQYPPKTEFVYSNFTPRKSYLPGVDHMVWFGLQYFIKEYLMRGFNENFFKRKKEDVMREYRRRVVTSLGADLPSYQHIEDLHDLGYLPLEIRSLPEGSRVPMRVPCMTIVNTDPKFFWLTNVLETLMSATLWRMCTSATIAVEYRKIFDKWGAKTGVPPEFIQWQGHDFSMRGMGALEAAICSSMGHLLCFTGTDTIPAIAALEEYYGANAEKELIGGSIAATEHSVMCTGTKENEPETYRRLVEDVYPKGNVSIVSDTWNLWNVVTNILPQLKDKIMARDGKVVIRPDSGDPVKIICGDETAAAGSPAHKGLVECLWDTFGGTTTATGHKLLDSHIGAIYGDSITRQRAEDICSRLDAKGFASQVVFGIGSFTYQYVTRDTFGCAIKATWAQIDGKPVPIEKDPVTDDGTKKSARGLIRVEKFTGEDYTLWDNQETSSGGLLEVRFKDGKLANTTTLAKVREKVAS